MDSSYYSEFRKAIKNEVEERKLSYERTVNVREWMKQLELAYEKEYRIWDDIDQIYEKVVDLRDLLKWEIGERRERETVSLGEHFRIFLKKNSFSTMWHCNVVELAEILLDAFENSSTAEER